MHPRGSIRPETRLQCGAGTLVALLSLLVPSIATATLTAEKGLGLPRDASVEGYRIDQLLQSTHMLVGALFLVMCVWGGLALWRFRSGHLATYAKGNDRRSVLITLSLTAFVFFVVDGNLSVNTLVDLREVFWNFQKPEQDPRTIRIEVNAHQWAWNARYAGVDGEFGTEDDVLTWNELPVVAGAPVYIQLVSTDVVHSFSVPNFRLKQDAVPGMVTRLWFHPRENAHGEYAIACTEHCGANHYKMGGVLRVLVRDEFERWHTEASALAKRGYDPDDVQAHWGWEWRP